MSVVQPVEIIDKNGKRNTVRKRLDSSTSGSKRNTTVTSSTREEESFDHPFFPDAEDKKTVKLIRKVFKGASEFRFEFEVERGSLYVMNRSVVLESGDVHSDDDNDESNLSRLDEVSDRLAEMYYSLGAFGSQRRVRVVNQESESRYIAIRLD
jgi:hypothetical protein